MFPCPVGLDQISKKRPEPQEMAGSRHPPEPPPDAGFYARESILATWAFLVPNPARSPRSRLLDNIGNSDSPIRLCSGLLVQWGFIVSWTIHELLERDCASSAGRSPLAHRPSHT